MPFQALRCIRISPAPKISEYTDTLIKMLMCIAFVPIFLSAQKRYTTR